MTTDSRTGNSAGGVGGFLDDLRWRGLLNQCTHERELSEHLASADVRTGGRRAYVGFDPTADSLTIGNLVGIVQLARWQRAGHTPVALMGGATGLIGDPSGKTAERQLRSKDEVNANVQKIRAIFERVLDFDASRPNRAVMRDNIEWFGGLSYIDALRDIGKHFSVNMMMQKDSVKERLTNRDQGISYTEFSYMILQAYDFAKLHTDAGVTLQMGGSDQFGNIVVGIDLIRRLESEALGALTVCMSVVANPQTSTQERAMAQKRVDELCAQWWKDCHTKRFNDGFDDWTHLDRFKFISAMGMHEPFYKRFLGNSTGFGLTWPLVTKADGTKFGKTESGAIWLTARSGESDTSPARTSAYQFYQFWLNAMDADVVRFLKFYTLLSREEIEALEASHAADPGKREAHRALAQHMTAMLHGQDQVAKVEAASKALFSGELSGLSREMFLDVLASAPSAAFDRARLAGEGVGLIDLLAECGLCKSKGEARTKLTEGGISVNGAKAAVDTRLTLASLVHGEFVALRKGKRDWFVTAWKG